MCHCSKSTSSSHCKCHCNITCLTPKIVVGSYLTSRFTQVDADTGKSNSTSNFYSFHKNGTATFHNTSLSNAPQSVKDGDGYRTPAIGSWKIKNNKLQAIFYDSVAYLTLDPSTSTDQGNTDINKSDWGIAEQGEFTRYTRIFELQGDNLVQTYSNFKGELNTVVDPTYVNNAITIESTNITQLKLFKIVPDDKYFPL